MSCQPEQVTAFVDGELAAGARAEVEAHLATCAACARQAAEEERLRATLRGLPAPALPEAIETRVRATLRRSGARRWHVLLPAAAVLLVGLLWGRGHAALVSSGIAFDHTHCFGKQTLPAQVTGSGDAVRAWFAARGTAVPALPAHVRGLQLAGGRFCPLVDRKVAHVYYRGAERTLSLYVVPAPVRFEPGAQAHAFGHGVELWPLADGALGLVADDGEDLSAFRRELQGDLAGVRAARTPASIAPAPAPAG